MKFGVFMAPFHPLGENPTLALHRDLELMSWLDYLGFDEAWIGEHHSAGWETISSPEIFIATAAERTKNIKFGTGVISLPYHHPLMVANRMILLDHLTKGRVMLGVGPGALVTDAYMLGIDPKTQRHKMDESLGIILKLLTEDEPITYHGDWFNLNEARVHLLPYSKPHFPIAVAAAQSPSGFVLAGKYGVGLLSLTSTPGGVQRKNTLADFWNMVEESASKNNRKVDRNEWRLVLHVHLADTKAEAIEQVRIGASKYQNDYFANTIGHDLDYDGPIENIVDDKVEKGVWVVGTPDDLIAKINDLEKESGGIGGIMFQVTEWGTREQVLHSYELIARYVIPQFNGSLENLEKSQLWSSNMKDRLATIRQSVLDKAKTDYDKNV
ncbi:MAG: LLM class flavin-dependent oxidoreductase [Chloroflexi bacterium]|nr:LLM class flavin-dependent oxidoreductase [Chloroflexota bacterium]|tara:strand:- start:13087 stop:14235 length:1149 start_codon:yes stop_codon:yes gene_type:complete